MHSLHFVAMFFLPSSSTYIFFSHLFLLNHPLLQCSNILLLCMQPQALVYVGNAYSSSTERCSCLCSLIRTVKYLIDHQVLTKGKIHWYHSLVCHSAPSSVLSLHSLFCLIHCEGFPPFSLPYIFRCGKCIGQEAAMCIGHSQLLNVWSIKSCVMSSSLYGSTKLQNLKCFDSFISRGSRSGWLSLRKCTLVLIICYYPPYNNDAGYFDTNALTFTKILLRFRTENCLNL